MVQPIDLAAIARGIDEPFELNGVAAAGGLETSIVICEGNEPWQRDPTRDELLFVLEGVVTLERSAGTLHVSEGELAVAPRNASYKAHSGMRSIAVLVQEKSGFLEERNGHYDDQPALHGALEKHNVAVSVARQPHFTWLPSGAVGHHAASATRLGGRSEPFRPRHGPMLVVVYRGVVDYWTRDSSGSVVGSQMLVVPVGEEITFLSERGATVLAISHEGQALPMSVDEPRPADRGEDEPEA